MKFAPLLLAVTGLVFAGWANPADPGDDLLNSKGCLKACHDLDKKKVGPSLKDLAAKHAGNKEAEATLVAKLKDGKGHMKVSASDAELKTMVQRVLAQK